MRYYSGTLTDTNRTDLDILRFLRLVARPPRATDALPAGLYFVQLLRGSEVISRQQLRIEK